MRVTSTAVLGLALAAAGAVLIGCGPAPSYNYRAPSTTYTSSYDATADLRQTAIDTVKKMAEVNESVAGKKSDAELIELSQQSVRDALKDPSSAQFRNVTVRKSEAGRVVCGEVNAKNSYGGYVGFRQFVAGVAGADTESTDTEYPNITRAANAGITMACR